MFHGRVLRVGVRRLLRPMPSPAGPQPARPSVRFGVPAVKPSGRFGRITRVRVVSLELVQEWFYHLDTCFCPLPSGELIYYPGAFDSYGQKVIEETVGSERLIPVRDDEARSFCCNAVAMENAVVMNVGAPELAKELGGRGMKVIETDLSEFIKSGGSAKCLTLRLKG